MINIKIKKQLAVVFTPLQLRDFYRLIEQKRRNLRPLVRRLRSSRAPHNHRHGIDTPSSRHNVSA